MNNKYIKVEGSDAAPMGGGILSAIIDIARKDCRTSFVKSVECDENQTEDEVEFFCHMAGDVILRCVVTEVIDKSKDFFPGRDFDQYKNS